MLTYRAWRHMTTMVVAPLVMKASLIASAGTAIAEETADTSRDVPNPTECQIDPLTLPLFDGTPMADMPTPDASPGTPQPGPDEPADEATVSAITATVRESIACANAGDLLRQFAFFSDRLLLNIFTGPDAADLPAFEAAVEAPPRPVLPTDRLALVEVRDVHILPDGRVTAIVVTEGTATRFTDSLTFAEVDGRWLIDAVNALDTDEVRPNP